ncbi:MAG: hypothetical protein NTZ09_12945 [Candidatus Hydrogenedentes bacterium]|nr:hypothetical protein [Candidatus Hydrogenedentota bacterium]
MRRRRKILIAALASLTFLAVATGYVQQKYEPIVAAPVVTHEAVATPRQTLRAVFYPPLARAALSGLLGLPEWIVEPLAPREIALLAAPNLDSETVELQVFVNEQRLGPVIAGYVNEPDLSQDVPFVQWDARGVVREGRGSMVLEGTMRIKPELAALLRSLRLAPTAPVPTLEGGHLFEAALSNEDEGAVATIVALMRYLNAEVAFDEEAVTRNLAALESVRIIADLVSEDAVVMQLFLNGRPGSEAAMGELAFLFEVAAPEATKYLNPKPLEIGLLESSERKGTEVVVKLTLNGLAKHFKGEDGDA